MDWVFEREIHDEAFLLHGLDCQTMDNGLDPYPNASDPAVIFLFFMELVGLLYSWPLALFFKLKRRLVEEECN